MVERCGVHDDKAEPLSKGWKVGRRSTSWLVTSYNKPDILDCSPTVACDVGALHYLQVWPC